MTRLVCLLVAVAFGATTSATGQTLAERLDRRLDAPGMEHLFWGVAVSDLDGKLLYARNAERLFIPASNTKLVISIVANALLGPDFTVTTTLYGSGPVTNGVLQGDLVLYGRGDPTFSSHCYRPDTTISGACDRDPFAKMRDLAEQLRNRGVRVIAGDVIADGSWFEPLLIHPAWENYDLGWWYAAPVSGLGFNDNAVDFREVAGDSAGKPVQLTMTPDLGAFALDNRTEVLPHGAARTFDIFRGLDGPGFLATGGLVAGSEPRTESAAVADPNRYAGLALRRELAAAGILVRGSLRTTIDSFDQAAARRNSPLGSVSSRPLRDWIYPILSASQNWFAEMTLKQLGRQRGTAGSWQEGRRIERRFLIDSVRIDSNEFVLQDGSGLAASNLIAPHAFTQLLAWAWHHPDFAVIHDALPQSGKPGTLKDRFVGTAAAGMVHAKTGSITGDNTLSGFVERPDGRVLVFSVMTNHHNLSTRTILAAIDSVVSEMAK